ncbi:hypothetical protein D3C85_1210110 [compost metagenome]
MKYRFVVDDDGHNYLIPADIASKFYAELEKEWCDPECKFEELFNQYRCNSVSNFTFENPEYK